MLTVTEVYDYLKSIAPPEMKMDFDNVGFLVGCAAGDANKILLSLDITSDVVSEALELGAGLIISHHPLFFSLKSVTDTDITGRKIVRLLSGNISAICMHTNLDAARGGTNDALAIAAGIADDGRQAQLLCKDGTLDNGHSYSYGRVGYLNSPLTLSEYLAMLKKSLNASGLRYHDADRAVFNVAVVCGSGGGQLHHAASLGCDTFVTADIKYDVFLEAKEMGINLIDGDHFCTENLVIAPLANKLRQAFPQADVLVSKKHRQTSCFY